MKLSGRLPAAEAVSVSTAAATCACSERLPALLRLDLGSAPPVACFGCIPERDSVDLKMKEVPEDTCDFLWEQRRQGGHCRVPEFRAATYSREIEYFDKIVPAGQSVNI